MFRKFHELKYLLPKQDLALAATAAEEKPKYNKLVLEFNEEAAWALRKVQGGREALEKIQSGEGE